MHKYDYTIKILLIGDSGVGKSSIMLKFVEEDYKSEYACTIGVDFKSIPITTTNNNYIKLLIWDTAGQERFQTITHIYYRGSNIVIIIYDITNRITFENIEIWLKEIEKYAPDNIIKILVGNKSDIENKRKVSKEEAEIFSTQNGFVKYYETSAKEDKNIEEMFMFIGNYYVLKTQKLIPTVNSNPTIKLITNTNTKIKNTKCNCM